jgi:hypothetical protein
MITVVSFAFAILILAGILFFFGVLAFEIFYRLRNRAFTPATQMRRADLGRYPHWER